MPDCEREHLQAAMGTLHRAFEGRILVPQRRRQEAMAKLAAEAKRRDAAIGPDLRAQAEKAMAQTQVNIDALDEKMIRLERREDVDFTIAKEKIHERVCAARSTQRLVEADLVIA